MKRRNANTGWSNRSYKKKRYTPRVPKRTTRQYTRKPKYQKVETASMPLSKRLMFTYNDVDTPVLAITAITDTTVYNQYKINSLYDINAAIGSTASVGFTEWTSFYTRYKVNWARISTTFINTSPYPCHVGIIFRPSPNETTWSSWTAWRNASVGNNYPCKTVMLTPSGGCLDRATLSVSCVLGKQLGNPDEHAGDTGYSAAYNANPSLIQDAFIFVLDVNGVPNPLELSVTTKTTIKIIADMYERRTLYT